MLSNGQNVSAKLVVVKCNYVLLVAQKHYTSAVKLNFAEKFILLLAFSVAICHRALLVLCAKLRLGSNTKVAVNITAVAVMLLKTKLKSACCFGGVVGLVLLRTFCLQQVAL